jgi:hypothetical protein
VLTQKFLLGVGDLDKWENADLNADKRVDAFDLVLLRQLIVSK